MRHNTKSCGRLEIYSVFFLLSPRLSVLSHRQPACEQCAWQRPPTTRPTTFYVWKTRGCQCSFRLLMMSGVSPETCWASYKYGIIKFWYIVASCWIFVYETAYLLNASTFNLCLSAVVTNGLDDREIGTQLPAETTSRKALQPTESPVKDWLTEFCPG